MTKVAEGQARRDAGRPGFDDTAFLVGLLKSARERGLNFSQAVRQIKQLRQMGYERDPATGQHRLVEQRIILPATLLRRARQAVRRLDDAYRVAAMVLEQPGARSTTGRLPGKPELLKMDRPARGRPKKIRASRS